jgi:hypothetical protein
LFLDLHLGHSTWKKGAMAFLLGVRWLATAQHLL